MAAKVKRGPAPFTRKGLHRLTCDGCAGFGYFTVAQLEHWMERHQALPECVCGERFRPERYELAALLGVEHPAEETLERDGYNRERSQVRALRGAQKACERFSGIGGAVPANMHHRALDALREQEREAARLRRGRRAGALVPVVEMPF